MALCDVDWGKAKRNFDLHPTAKKYRDFREMLDKEGKNIDAVTVSTPDHTHAVVAMHAMERGKHVYVQKPLAHDIYETRMLTEAARSVQAAQPIQTQVGGDVFAANGQRVGSYRGTAVTTDPAGAALAQSAINADTSAQMASIQAGSETRMQEINRVILKTTTVMPGQTYHGGLEINNTGMGDPVSIHVAFAGEEHDFSFHLSR